MAAFLITFLLQLPYLVPTGSDVGHYLALARTFPANLTYSPMIPLLMSPFARWVSLGSYIPLKLFIAIVFSLMVLSFFVLVNEASSDVRVAFLGAVLTAFSGLQLESVAWGALPQILALGFSFASLNFAIRWTRTDDLRNAVLAGAFLGLTFLTHDITSVFALVSCLAYALMARPRTMFRGLALGGAVSAPCALVGVLVLAPQNMVSVTPLVAHLSPGLAYLILVRIAGWSGVADLASLASLLFLMLFSLATILLGGRLKRSLRLLLPSIALGSLAVAFFTPIQFPDRWSYFLFFPVALSACLCGTLLVRRSWSQLLVVVLVLMTVIGGAAHFYSAGNFYGSVTATDLQAFDCSRLTVRRRMGSSCTPRLLLHNPGGWKG